jgi:tRNA A37 methylthiotransferase MiaB
VEYKIFGCKVNKYYLNKRLDFLAPKEKEDDYIIATCVVTDRAKNKFIKETLHQIQKNKHVYLT